MHDTRLQVLDAIKIQRQTTVAAIAESLNLTPISVRHHLATLQAEGLVKIEIERQGVGRPRHLYSLTEAAQRFFPTKYHLLADRLLNELKAHLPPESVEQIIDGLAENVAARYGTVSPKSTLEERLEHLVSVLGEEGFMVEIRRDGNTTVVAEMNCPYLYVGQRHPEVCRIDRMLIKSVLGDKARQTACVLHGDNACTFSVEDESAISAG